MQQSAGLHAMTSGRQAAMAGAAWRYDLYGLIREAGWNRRKPAPYETYVAAVETYWNDWATRA